MRSGKAPGPSGIPVELFSHADEATLAALHTYVNGVFRSRVMPGVAKKGLLACIPKAEGKFALTNCRPLTMLEHAGMKLVTSILLSRLQHVIQEHKLLHPMQYAGLSGGNTTDPLFMRQQVCESAAANRDELHIFDSDCSRAFDSVETWAIS